MDILRFVDRIDASPTVRLDLNDGITWGANYDGTDFSPPPLKTSYANSLLADGERLSASAYSNRTITLSLDLIETTQDAFGLQLQNLWRELNRPTNFLMWQPDGASQPVFFRTIRSSNTTVIDVPSGAVRTVSVSIDAEPFAYGLKEQLASVLVYNSPSQGETLNKNPYFRAGLSTSYWTGTGGTITRSTAQLHEGTGSLLLTPSGVAPQSYAESEKCPIEPGWRHVGEAWVRCAATRQVSMNINWWTAGDVYIDTSIATFNITANVWTFVRVQGTPPANAAKATIVPTMDGTPSASHLLYIDEARLYRSASAGEAPPANPLNATSTFESGVSPWTGQNSTLEQSSTVALNGTFSCKVTPSGSASPAAPRSEDIPVTPEVLYTASGWMYSPLGWADTSIAIDWLDSGGSIIWTDASTGVAIPAATWRKYTATFMAPSTAVNARFRLRLSGATPAVTDVVYVDDCRFHRAGTDGGLSFDILSPKGDVETPLYMSVSSSVVNTSAQGPFTSLFAVRRRGTPANVPLLLEAEDMTRAANTTAGTSDITDARVMSGGNYVFTTMTGLDTFTTNVSTSQFPATPSVDARGTYRVFMRYRYATAGTVDSTTVRLRWGRSGASLTELISNDAVTLPHDGTKFAYADLGLVQIPSGYDPVYDGVSGVQLPAEGIYFRVQVAAEDSVYTTLDTDCFVLVPADDRMLYVRWPVTDATQPAENIVDGSAGDVYSRNDTGALTTLPGAALSGGAPMLSPGVTNRIYYLRDVGAQTVIGDNIDASVSITCHYWPRYLTVRGAAT